MDDLEAGESDTLLGDLRRLVREISAEAAKPVEGPESEWRLDLASRQHSPERAVRHIHQMCLSHGLHFRRGNFVSLVYLSQFYVNEVAACNPLGICAAARAILELHVFLRHVQIRLISLKSDGHENWKTRGEKFFDALIRARFSTRVPRKLAALKRAGVPEELLRPHKITECISTVDSSSPSECGWLLEHYRLLCDYVHASVGSQTISITNTRLASGMHVGKARLLFGKQGAVVKHEYPSHAAYNWAVSVTLEKALYSCKDALAAINSTPESPFDSAELKKVTGDERGMRVLVPAGEAAARNSPCPCGSGKKYKRCHGIN